MTNDILDQLRHFKPDPEVLELRWPAESRAGLAELIRHDEVGTRARLRHRPRRRWVVAASVTVAAAVAAAVPALLPDGVPGAASPAAAAALEQLARVAARAPVDTARPGQFVHTVLREHTIGVPEGTADGSVPNVIETRDSWRASDGRLWQRDVAVDVTGTTFGRKPQTSTEVIPASEYSTEAAYLESLPTDAGDLDRYLRAHVSGSDSTDEAVFVAVGDMLRGGTASAGVRSAAVTVLARTDHVRLGPVSRDGLGRDVQEFDFVNEGDRPGVVEALLFDTRTAQLIGERTTQPGAEHTTSVLVSEVVDSVPADVLRTAVPQK